VALTAPAVQLIVEFTDDEGNDVVQPVIAIGVTAIGDATLLVADGEGFVLEAGHGHNDYCVRPRRPDDVLT
jgi:hypothetical protein